MTYKALQNIDVKHNHNKTATVISINTSINLYLVNH